MPSVLAIPVPESEINMISFTSLSQVGYNLTSLVENKLLKIAAEVVVGVG